MGSKYDRFHFGAINLAARILGVGSLITGSAFVLSAIYADSDHALFAVAGAALLVTGVAFLLVKPTSRADAEDFLAGRPGQQRTGTYEKRK